MSQLHMDEYVLHVTGMSCRSCERRIADALTKLDGIKIVDASAETDRVLVEGDPDTQDRARQAVRETGYTIES